MIFGWTGEQWAYAKQRHKLHGNAELAADLQGMIALQAWWCSHNWPDRLARAATRLAGTFERRTESSEDIIDAVGVLLAQRDLIEAYYLTPDAAHEASQGAYMQAAWLEEQANNSPDPHKRRELLARARTALAAGDKLRGCDERRPEQTAERAAWRHLGPPCRPDLQARHSPSHHCPHVGLVVARRAGNDARKTMHTAPMSDSQGEFAEFKTQPDVPCRKCGVHAVSMREWESSCGGWEDYQYKCHHCGHTWWVEGIDA